MNFKRLLHTPLGKILISIVLGLGLASLFQKTCKGKNCINFSGPVIKEVDGKIFKYDNNCYKYEVEHIACNDTKQTVKFTGEPKEP